MKHSIKHLEEVASSPSIPEDEKRRTVTRLIVYSSLYNIEASLEAYKHLFFRDEKMAMDRAYNSTLSMIKSLERLSNNPAFKKAIAETRAQSAGIQELLSLVTLAPDVREITEYVSKVIRYERDLANGERPIGIGWSEVGELTLRNSDIVFIKMHRGAFPIVCVVEIDDEGMWFVDTNNGSRYASTHVSYVQLDHG